MNNKIMFVDDEQHILTSYRRIFRKEYQISTALGPDTGLNLIKEKGPFAVVVSDMRMPGMNGVQFLSKIKDLSPDTIRIMLTGYADFNTAMEAVNEGNIFRFLTKPCPPDSLLKVIKDALRQYELVKAEQILLSKTLKGSIKVLIEILSMVDQQSFSRAIQMRDFIRKLNTAKIITTNWETEIAVLLTRIGQVTVPNTVISKWNKGEELSKAESEMIQKIPQIGHDLLVNIPRLDSVAKVVLYQNKGYDGSGFPNDEIKGVQIPHSARIIKILNDLLDIEEGGISRGEASAKLNANSELYDPNLLNVILKNIGPVKSELRTRAIKPEPIGLKYLKIGHQLVEGIETEAGQLLVMAGQEITESVLIRIRNWATLYKIKEPIVVSKMSNQY